MDSMKSYANWYDKNYPSEQHQRCIDTAYRMSDSVNAYRKKYEFNKIEQELKKNKLENESPSIHPKI